MSATVTQISEATALLSPTGLHSCEQAISDGSFSRNPEDGIKLNPQLETTWKAESKLLLRYSGPLALTYFLQYSYNLTVIFVVGHLGRDELAAVSLATMTANIIGLAIFEGLATSLDTLCAQAYGSGRKEFVGLHMQRMVYFLWLVAIPVGAVWFCSPWILRTIVPEQNLAVLAGSYLRVYMICLPGYTTFEAGKRFVQAQGNFTASLVVLLLCAPVNVLLSWLFVFHLHWGIRGAALAAALTINLQPILLLSYLRFIAPSTFQCWPGFTRAAFRRWLPMIRLSIPGVLMTFSEWLAFDILTFSASYISTTHLAAQTVLVTTCVLIYHIPFPASVAVSTRIGNLIGRGALDAAKAAAKTHAIIFIVIGLFDMSILVALKGVIPKAFTEDEDVRLLITQALPVVAAFQLFDATTACCNGILRGLGRQAIGGWANLGVYYVYAVPLSMFLEFGPLQLGLYGLWAGPGSGLGLVTVFESLVMKIMNWQRCIDDARSRME